LGKSIVDFRDAGEFQIGFIHIPPFHVRTAGFCARGVTALGERTSNLRYGAAVILPWKTG
jgi:hypothetical protein